MVKYATTENVTAPSEWKPQVIYVSTKPSGIGMDGNSIRQSKKETADVKQKILLHTVSV